MSQVIKDSKSLGDLIRLRRKDLKLTQAQLAELAQVSPRYVFDLEDGKTSVRLDKLLPVLETLGLTMNLKVGA
jgi:HTH-type transcriptional regulator/antitoxin HipB